MPTAIGHDDWSSIRPARKGVKDGLFVGIAQATGGIAVSDDSFALLQDDHLWPRSGRVLGATASANRQRIRSDAPRDYRRHSSASSPRSSDWRFSRCSGVQVSCPRTCVVRGKVTTPRFR
ncbi:hypothetical protein QF048_006576 [Streptomyces sp. W4I9-2]|nr:hypothetical protein [Streptomyces sp. W4I9-2]